MSTQLIIRWRKDADQYKRQVDEAQGKGLPHDQMLSAVTFLRQCAKELESIAEPVANRLIELEIKLRAETAGKQPGNRTADEIALIRRKLQEDAGLVDVM